MEHEFEPDYQAVIAAIDQPSSRLFSQTLRNRFLIRATIVGLVLTVLSLGFDVFLTVRIWDNQNQTNRVAKTAAATANGLAYSAESSAYITCTSANESRATEVELWDFILALPPQPGQTAQQQAAFQKTADQFKAFLNTAFAQRDCGPRPQPPRVP